MIYLIVILVMVLAFAIVYGILYQMDLLEPPSRSGSATEGFGAGPFRVPHFGELPQGCLLTVILVSLVWFVAWAVVLILALRVLRSPLG